jgi:dTDP-3,4-didehydro-2,6-dideoxy-alpha-D-glucose 3-reductase
MSDLRVAVWGLGPHAVKRILPAIASIPGLQLYGVCSRNGEAVSAQARRFNCKGWTDPAPMLGDSMLNVVYVSTPIGLHAEHGRGVLRAGKNLWCEKPLTTRLDATLELLDTAERQHLAVCEGLMYLHHPQFRQLSAYVDGGRLGAVLSVTSVFGIPRLDYPSFRTDPERGGGALFDVGCYPVSAVHALFPEQTTRVIVSKTGTRDGSAVDTDGIVVLEIANGATACLEWRINCAYRNEITLWGTEGSLRTHQIFSKPPTYAPEFAIRDVRGVETIESADSADHFVTMLQHFAAITNGRIDASRDRLRIARTAAVLDEIWGRRNQ